MIDKDLKAASSSVSAKRAWVQPTIDVAPARKAKAAVGPPGIVDYGLYS